MQKRWENKIKKKANQFFSAIYLIAIILGIAIAVLGQFILPFTSRMLGAEGEMLTEGIEFSRVTLMFIPAVILQYVNQYMFPTAEKSKVRQDLCPIFMSDMISSSLI